MVIRSCMQFGFGILLSLSLVAPSAYGFDVIDESVTWATVAQGHHQNSNNSCHKINDPQLQLQSGARITGTLGLPLVYCSNNLGSGLPSNSCDTAVGGDRFCDVTGSDLRGLSLNGSNAFQSSNGSDGGVSFCSANQSISLGNNGENQFGSLSLYSACTVTMSSSQSEYRFQSIAAGNGAKLVFSAGDYWINSLTLNQDAEIILQGGARIFIGTSTQFNGAKINQANNHSLQLVAYDNLQLVSGAVISGNVYSDETLSLDNNSAINGRVNSKYLRISTGTITDAKPVVVPFHIQFGKATTDRIVFEQAFPAGVTPLIFLMPSISNNNPTVNDGPQSAFLTTVSNTEFRWQRREPPLNTVSGAAMPEMHWIAVTAGSHDLSNGTQLIAGTVDINQALIGSNSPYTQVTLANTQDVVLHQLQTAVNDCWLTSTSQFTSSGIELALDASEVRTGNTQCRPAGLTNSQLQTEKVAYMSLASGSGALILNGENVNYHFGRSQTFTAGGVQDVNYQCGITTPLLGFTSVPMLVAGKNSRRGGDGGWLRRCQLTNAAVSMVIDEDTYIDSDRRHIWENYSFVAIEKLTKVKQCFTDDFQRTALGSDWAVSGSAGSVTPAIVNNRLRVTEARGNQATSSTYQRLFPAVGNLVEIEFDHYAYGGTGADGVAFVLSDASITPQAGAYGGPLGYGARSNVNGFAGGWLGFGIDEYGNFSGEGSNESGANIGRRRQSVAVRGSGSGTSGYRYLRGACSNGTTNTTGNCLSPTVDNNNVSPAYRYRITIDSQIAGQSLVKVERNVGSGFTEVVPEFNAMTQTGQAAVPEDFLLSLTGSTGGATNNHEIDNVEICALESKPIGVVIDHFEFDHSGNGLTCGAETITIKACADAACSQTVPDFVTATLSPTTSTDGGWVGGNVVSFSGGSTTLSLRKNTPGVVNINVIGSTPGAKPFSTTLCRIAGGPATQANCQLTYSDSGFIFDVPDKLANKPSNNVIISAVKKSDTSQQCVPGFSNVSKTVSFWSSYVSPNASAIINPQPVSINNTNVGQQSISATPITLQFDANGQARFDANYPDAGQIQIDARYTGTGNEQGLVMLGDDRFVSFPVGLCVTPVDTNAQCNAGNSSCNVYKKAGESFDLRIQGKAWQVDGDANFCDNANTPNYAQQGLVLSHQLVAPAGGVLGAISQTSYNHLAQTTNTNTVSQTVSEVGVFQFNANPPLGYLGSSFYDIPLASSSSIGRFVPDHFLIDSVSVLPACGVFTYMDQPFDMALNINARNTLSQPTQNYHSGFAKGSAVLVAENANNGTALDARLSALPVNASSWVNGVASLGVNYQAVFSRTLPANADGPFTLLDIGVRVADNDGNFAVVTAPDMLSSTAGDCTASSTCNAKRITTQDLRHGRVIMDNTYGPEVEVLRMPTYAQYWSGSDWISNTNDSCTIMNGLLPGTEVYQPLLTSGQIVSRSAQASTLITGNQMLLWQNTGSSLYRGQVTSPLDVPIWLEWYWNWDGVNFNQLYDPRASAFFGRYRGHDRVIYWEEVSQ